MGKKIVYSIVVFSLLFGLILLATLRNHPELTSKVGTRLSQQFQLWLSNEKKSDSVELAELQELVTIPAAQLPEHLSAELPPYTKGLRLQVKESFGIKINSLDPFELQDQIVSAKSPKPVLLNVIIDWQNSALESNKDSDFKIPPTLQAEIAEFAREHVAHDVSEKYSKIEPLAKSSLEKIVKDWLIDNFPKDRAKIGVTVQFR